uniref:Uncharacterized protein n=1 Tax=Hirsutella thompsonii TaxID=42368 RepID=A0A3G2ZQ21_HIRTH|nr:hypothetical protein [Hirsutella thompsonii]
MRVGFCIDILWMLFDCFSMFLCTTEGVNIMNLILIMNCYLMTSPLMIHIGELTRDTNFRWRPPYNEFLLKILALFLSILIPNSLLVVFMGLIIALGIVIYKTKSCEILSKLVTREYIQSYFTDYKGILVSLLIILIVPFLPLGYIICAFFRYSIAFTLLSYILIIFLEDDKDKLYSNIKNIVRLFARLVLLCGIVMSGVVLMDIHKLLNNQPDNTDKPKKPNKPNKPNKPDTNTYNLSDNKNKSKKVKKHTKKSNLLDKDKSKVRKHTKKINPNTVKPVLTPVQEQEAKKMYDILEKIKQRFKDKQRDREHNIFSYTKYSEPFTNSEKEFLVDSLNKITPEAQYEVLKQNWIKNGKVEAEEGDLIERTYGKPDKDTHGNNCEQRWKLKSTRRCESTDNYIKFLRQACIGYITGKTGDYKRCITKMPKQQDNTEDKNS